MFLILLILNDFLDISVWLSNLFFNVLFLLFCGLYILKLVLCCVDRKSVSTYFKIYMDAEHKHNKFLSSNFFIKKIILIFLMPFLITKGNIPFLKLEGWSILGTYLGNLVFCYLYDWLLITCGHLYIFFLDQIYIFVRSLVVKRYYQLFLYGW